MVDVHREFYLDAPITKSWEFLSDMKEVGMSMPNCKQVREIGPNQYEWLIEAKTFLTKRLIKMRTQATIIEEPRHCEFLGNGEMIEKLGIYKMTFKGSMNLIPTPDERTKVQFAGDISTLGTGGSIINKVISGFVDELADEFTNNLNSRLRAKTTG